VPAVIGKPDYSENGHGCAANGHICDDWCKGLGYNYGRCRKRSFIRPCGKCQCSDSDSRPCLGIGRR